MDNHVCDKPTILAFGYDFDKEEVAITDRHFLFVKVITERQNCRLVANVVIHLAPSRSWLWRCRNNRGRFLRRCSSIPCERKRPRKGRCPCRGQRPFALALVSTDQSATQKGRRASR